MPFDLKSIKSLFIVEEPTAGKKQEEEKNSAETPTPGGSPVIVEEFAASEPGKVSAKFIEVLFSAMEKANLPGVDYLEYRQSLKSLEKMPMDEQVRYQSAFAMAQAMGATPQKLIESATHYADVLKTEESKFEQALKHQIAERIGNRQEMLKNLEQTIQQKAEQIKKLNQEMEQHRQEMDKLSGEIKESTGKVEATKSDFIASYNVLVAQIQGDVENMKKYLK
jgi:uncharacterized coiled-coil protein SlyX